MSFLAEVKELREIETPKYPDFCCKYVEEIIKSRLKQNPTKTAFTILYDKHFSSNVSDHVRKHFENQGFKVRTLREIGAFNLCWCFIEDEDIGLVISLKE